MTVTTGSSTLKSLGGTSNISDKEYDELASAFAGIDPYKNGVRNCTYEETLKYGTILTNLRKYGIKKGMSDEEKAAAAAGIAFKNNTPQIANEKDFVNYYSMLGNLHASDICDINVSSGAGENANESTIGGTEDFSLSKALTGTYSQGFENYLRELERQFGTVYIFNNVFNGDKSKYDPVKRAEALCGFSYDEIKDDATKKKYNDVLNGINSSSLSVKGDYKQFLIDLGYNESGSDYSCVNSYGYMGKYQIGYMALMDLGYVVENDDGTYTWTDKANKLGIYSEKEFLNNVNNSQELIKKEYDQKNWQYLKAYDAVSYVGKTISGVKITQSGLLAAASLVGAYGVAKALKNNDLDSVADANGVTTKYYFSKFANYDISEILS
ncbi:MAG: hypothetical protein IJZ72_03000 [Oscillospiraceae bacterium]|nr:hypothetical protein [Oscillospiraceae bacterium]